MNISRIDKFESRVNKLRDLRASREQSYEDAVEESQLATEEFEASEAALAIAQSTAKEIQERVHGRISTIVSKCVSTVFGDNYDFRIEFVEKRSKTEANLVILKDGVPRDPLTECGGGVVDIIAFALRVAAISLHRPKLVPLLVLDEPFRFVSRQYKPAAAELLQTLADDMGIQIIMVTHESAFEIGNVVEIGT